MIEEVFTGYGEKEIMEREESFDKLALEIFSHYKLHEHIELLCPQCLVRVLPKDMFYGSIYIPDVAASNKPIYEGIIIRTWKPRMITTLKDDIVPLREIRSELEPGDHVLFPHFAGQPLPGLNEEKYRCVPEGITRKGQIIFGNDVGCIFAKVNYQRPRVEDVFMQVYLANARIHPPNTTAFTNGMLRALQEEFDMIVKVKGSRTKTGV